MEPESDREDSLSDHSLHRPDPDRFIHQQMETPLGPDPFVVFAGTVDYRLCGFLRNKIPEYSVTDP